jgi:hypothetical protein
VAGQTFSKILSKKVWELGWLVCGLNTQMGSPLRRTPRNFASRRDRAALTRHSHTAPLRLALWAPAWSTKFQLTSAMKFMVLTHIASPIEPNGGRHVYSFRLEESHERFDMPWMSSSSNGCRRAIKFTSGKTFIDHTHPLGFAKANRA